MRVRAGGGPEDSRTMSSVASSVRRGVASGSSMSRSDLRLSSIKMPADREVEISATVSNVGERAGDEVVELCVRGVAASLTRPSRSCAVRCA
jgi:hypothetical protein